MAKNLAAAVAEACKGLDGWPEITAPDGYPTSLALCTLDSLWSMGVRYSGVVNVLDRYRS